MASSRFMGASADVADSLVDTCKDMGNELGVAVSGSDPKAACDPVINALRNEMRDLRAEASLTVEVAATPPRCEVSMDAYAECAASCEAEVEPGEVNLECEGGYVVGECSAQCTGECNVEVQGKCQGTCEGTCTAQCQGTCNGTCEGTCAAKNAQGECAGKCEGTCHGTCEGGCQGSCEGECWVSGKASCSGECRGGCSVDYEAPRCTGEVKPPRVSAECEASCDAQLNAEAKCEPGQVEVVVTGDVSSNIEPKLAKVRGAIRAGYAGIMATGEKLRRLRAAGQGLVDAGAELRGSFSGMGMQAVRAGECVSMALSAVPEALGSVSASFEVSVSMSASVSAG
jgi:hypothetical protein